MNKKFKLCGDEFELLAGFTADFTSRRPTAGAREFFGRKFMPNHFPRQMLGKLPAAMLLGFSSPTSQELYFLGVLLCFLNEFGQLVEIEKHQLIGMDESLAPHGEELF